MQYSYLAGIYDTKMEDVDYKKWAEYLNLMLKKTNAAKIYEAACGTGNLTFELAELGYDITASDISAPMLSEAKRKNADICAGVRFVHQDMKNIETARKVDAVVSACDGPNYVDSNGLFAFFTSAYKALKKGGSLLFDISSEYKLKTIMDGQVYFDESDDSSCIWQNSFDKKNNELIMDVTIFSRNGELFERNHEVHIQYAHKEYDVINALLSAGFCDISVYECFTFKEPKPDSQRIQFAALKL